MVVNLKGGSQKRFIELPSASDVYYGNFVGGAVDFFGSKDVLAYAQHMESSGGYFKYRWTDQTYWHNALGLFAKNFESRVISIERDRIYPAVTSTHGKAFVHSPALVGALLKKFETNMNRPISLH